MNEDFFATRLEDLPRMLRIFPLQRAVLLPGQNLPLNIFEPRYLHMVFDALGNGRMIAMIQPRDSGADGEEPPIFDVGCAGRITSFEETGDGRLLIQLTGTCRFEVEQEVEPTNGYRRVLPDWSRYAADLQPPPEPGIGFSDLEEALRRFAAANRLQMPWDALPTLPSATLIDLLCMQLPLDVKDVQALIEADTMVERAHALRAVLEIAAPPASSPTTRH